MSSLMDLGAAHQAYGAAAKPAMPNMQAAKTHKQARETAEQFEAVFLAQMLQPMFADIKPEEPFGGGSSEAMWRSMQIEEYGKAIAKAGGIGIADAVYKEMIKLQELR
ncbi:MAG: rod-binding protein [Rhodospirillaceae bacterium]